MVRQFVNKLQITNIKFIFHSKKTLSEWTSEKTFCKIHSLCKNYTSLSKVWKRVCGRFILHKLFFTHVPKPVVKMLPTGSQLMSQRLRIAVTLEWTKTIKAGCLLLCVMWKREGKKAFSQWECETIQNSSRVQHKVTPFPSPSLPHLVFGLHRKGNVLSDFDKLLFFGLAIIQKKNILEITTVCVLHDKFTC